MDTRVSPYRTIQSQNGAMRVDSGRRYSGFNWWHSRWNGYNVPPPESGCVLWPPGHPGEGATIQDFSGSGNNGTTVGATRTRLSSGLWVLRFDGTDDVINCGSADVLDALTGNCTFEAWIKPTSLGESSLGTIIDKVRFTLYVQATARAIFGVTVGTVFKYAAAANNSVPFGYWSYVVGVFNSVNALIYTNLTLVTGDATAGPIDSHSVYSLLVGDNAASNRCFDGLIGLPRAYNRALSATEIANHYQQERHLFGV